jgi:hypothetical protein
MGIEPTSLAWKAKVLPLNYTRSLSEQIQAGITFHHKTTPAPIFFHITPLTWWRGEDSNLRRLSRQIYSLIPLATREPLRNASRVL